MFSLNISPLVWAALATEAATILLTLFYLLNPLRRIAKLPEAEPTAPLSCETEEEPIQKEPSDFPTDGRPKVSVIIYSNVNEEMLDCYLKSIFAQEYPDFEVIVVCDGTHEESEFYTEKYSRIYSNLHFTFIPPGSHNLSRRKLATTLGMKAASGEVAVTTVANARIPSTLWLATLCAPFDDPAVDISLGYSHIAGEELRGFGKWYREFVSLLTNAQWIGYALDGHPYRGDGYNLAFRRQVFFKHKGYAQTIYLHAGDDDIFVNEIASGENTAVEISSHSIISTLWHGSAARVWSIRKERYDFTSRWLPRWPFLRAGATSLMQWLAAGSCAAAVTLGLPSVIPAIAAGFMLLFFWLDEIRLYRIAASRLEATRLWWSVPFFWLFRPVANAWFRFSHRNSKIKNFTWQRRPKGIFGRNPK